MRSKGFMGFMTTSMAFVLGWPTFAGSMTGYTPTSRAFVKNLNSSLIQFPDFQPVAYIIHDGWRVGLTGDYAVPFSNYNMSENGYGKCNTSRVSRTAC